MDEPQPSLGSSAQKANDEPETTQEDSGPRICATLMLRGAYKPSVLAKALANVRTRSSRNESNQSWMMLDYASEDVVSHRYSDLWLSPEQLSKTANDAGLHIDTAGAERLIVERNRLGPLSGGPESPADACLRDYISLIDRLVVEVANTVLQEQDASAP